MLIAGVYLCPVDERGVAGEQGNQGGEGGGRDRAGQFRGERTEKGTPPALGNHPCEFWCGSGSRSGSPDPYL
jgi:hypothetical protein